MEFDGDISEGDEISVDFDNGIITNHTKNTQGKFPPFPQFLQNIINAGGLLNSLKSNT